MSKKTKTTETTETTEQPWANTKLTEKSLQSLAYQDHVADLWIAKGMAIGQGLLDAKQRMVDIDIHERSRKGDEFARLYSDYVVRGLPQHVAYTTACNVLDIPAVATEDDFQQDEPESVQEANEAIERLRELNQLADERLDSIERTLDELDQRREERNQDNGEGQPNEVW